MRRRGRRLRRDGRTAVDVCVRHGAAQRLLAKAPAVWAAVNDTTTPVPARVDA